MAIAPLPSALRPLPSTGGLRGEYGLADVARQLGLLHFTAEIIIKHLRAHARDENMPLPKTSRLHAGKIVKGPDCIFRLSRWDAELFDGWLCRRQQTPSDPHPVPQPVLRQQMKQRALRLVQGGKS